MSLLADFDGGPNGRPASYREPMARDVAHVRCAVSDASALLAGYLAHLVRAMDAWVHALG